MRYLSSAIDIQITPKKTVGDEPIKASTIQMNGNTVWGWPYWEPDMFEYQINTHTGISVPSVRGLSDKGKALLRNPATKVVDYTKAKVDGFGTAGFLRDVPQGTNIDTVILSGRMLSLGTGVCANLKHIRRFSFGPVRRISGTFEVSEFLCPLIFPETLEYIHSGTFDKATFNHDSEYDVYIPKTCKLAKDAISPNIRVCKY